MFLLKEATDFCLGVGCMAKCKSCIHEEVWKELNELDNEERLLHQSGMHRINETQCQITSGCYYKPMLDES